MDDVEMRAATLTASPAGCALLLVVEEAGLAPEVVARPSVAVHAAAGGVYELSVFMSGHDWMIAAVLAEEPRLMPLARAILSRPEAAWWFAPLDRTAQQWLGHVDDAPDPDRLVTPTGPPTNFERYAPKPRGRLVTSTGVDGMSSFLAAHYHRVNDYDDRPPYARYRLQVSADARVFEVDSAVAWRRLCVQYPAEGEDGRIVPDWAAVAREWDAVHLTLGGMLLAEQMRLDGPDGWTEHWAWETEQTAWLRWRFEAAERLPDLLDLPGPGGRHPDLPDVVTSLIWPWKLRRPTDGVSTLDVPPIPEERGAPTIRLPLPNMAAPARGESSARIAPDFDQIAASEGAMPHPSPAVSWPGPLSIATRGVILELDPSVLLIRIHVRLFRSIDGPWQASVWLPDGWNDVYVAVTADCSIPGAPAASRLRRFPADGAAWIFTLRRA